MNNLSLSYREVLPDTNNQEEWIEIPINTGGTQALLQDIKVVGKAGGYCFQNVELQHNRNRFIYWRTYQDVLELSEISLDFNLYHNNIRYKFRDSPVISVSIIEQDRYVTILVITVSTLHRMNFPHPDTLTDGSSFGTCSGSGTSSGRSSAAASTDFCDSQSFSIFREANAATARDPANFYVFDTQINSAIPHTASSCLSSNGEEAYFGVACQSQLVLYVMSNITGNTIAHHLKEHTIMPRLFSNLKGALTGKNDISDADYPTCITFNIIKKQIYLLALYRNDFLRVWSGSTMQIVHSISCVRDGNELRMQGPQCNILRKIRETSVCVFLSHSTGAEFVIIDIINDRNNQNNLSLVHRKVISAPQLDLTDFDVSETHIWALWSNAEGEFSVSNFSLIRGMGMNWVSAAMEPPPDRYSVNIEQGMDPGEAYCSYIFHPGKFERNVISKALQMFRRSNVRFDNKHSTLSMLKDQVCQSIDDEIQAECKELELCDDEYLDLTTRLWERFYSCCEQYHMKSSQPIGLLTLQPIDGVCVIKKNTFSLLRPCELLEHLMLIGEDVDTNVVLPLHFHRNESVGHDLINLVSIIAQLEIWLSEDIKLDLDKKLYQLEMPNVLIKTLVDEILAGDPDNGSLPRNFIVLIRQKLQLITDMCQAMAVLLDTLRVDNGSPEAMLTNTSYINSNRFLMLVGALFGSHIGVSVLSETVRQTSLIRFAICRNLLILQQIIVETYCLPVDSLEEIRSKFMPNTIIFLQSYYVMVWICETPVNVNLASTLETSIQRLNLLQLTNGSGRIFSNGKCYTIPLLRVFLNAKGLYTSLGLYSNTFQKLDSFTWQTTLLPLTTIVSQLIWAVSFNFVFGEWLFNTCQHTIIENYVRLLNNWCEWNICSRQFILAVILLDTGETYKAYDLFLQSAKGVMKEQFLSEKILKDVHFLENITGDEEDEDRINLSNRAISHYYLKVIQIFEQHNALDHIISMAQVAIGLLEKNDPQLPMFQSIIFNNHLQLEHYEEAYHSLIYNAELSRRKDCLRQLVITLFNCKRFDLLMRFPYVGLHEEFENIVESRARSLVIEQNNIYDFLYAFHINNNNMRKASAIMYEQAMRFQLESETLDSLQKRCSSLLVCINALYLIDHRYQWIAKPVIGEDLLTNSINNNENEMDIDEVRKNNQQVIVLEIKDIKKELLHTEALVQLTQHRKDFNAYINAGPQELTVILANCRLFTASIKLAKGFQLSLLPIFEAIASACVRTSDDDLNDAWTWLQENDLADIPYRNKPADMAWSLLQKLVNDNEEENSTIIRKSVVDKLLSINTFIPQWLANDYKLANCYEYLYLFTKHSRLLEAAELAQEIILGMLGSGNEYFSFKTSLTITNQSMCLPVNTLDLLLHGLKQNAEENIEYKEAASELQDTIEKYIDVALRTGKDKVQIVQQLHQEQLKVSINSQHEF